MKKEITVGQLLSVAATLLIALATGWITINNKVSRHDAEIKTTHESINRIEDKVDKVNELSTRILIEMQNKQDRPK